MSEGTVQHSWPGSLLGRRRARAISWHTRSALRRLATAVSWNNAISFQPKMLLPELLHLVNKMLQTSSLLAA